MDIAGTKSSDRVGIVGLGGLGHLAVQYARAWGCDPIVFSQNPNKKEDALKLGAKEFYVIPSSKEAKLDIVAGVNVLLLCGGALPDFNMYVLLSDLYRLLNTDDIFRFMPALARRATIVPVIIQGDPLVIP